MSILDYGRLHDEAVTIREQVSTCAIAASIPKEVLEETLRRIASGGEDYTCHALGEACSELPERTARHCSIAWAALYKPLDLTITSAWCYPQPGRRWVTLDGMRQRVEFDAGRTIRVRMLNAAMSQDDQLIRELRDELHANYISEN